MNKQLASKGTTLNKNMTNTESLVLDSIGCTNASVTICTSNYIKSNGLTCNEIDIPISQPAQPWYNGTMYFNSTTN